MWPFRSPPARDPDPPKPDFELAVVDDVVDPRLVVYHEPAGALAEQYRAFRTNIRAITPKNEPRTLLFTSAHPREGKSVTVANIACALAESESLRVALVDGDLRGGTLHKLFAAHPMPGLSDVLRDGVSPKKALQSTPLSNLSLLPAGRVSDNPGELFASAYIQELLSYLKRGHDYVIVDTPPLLAFADACELSRLMDGVVLVVAINETTRRDAELALGQLEAAGANVIGTFVTGTQPADEGREPGPDYDPPEPGAAA
jgi:capsular exopolysaccharide synthesis family protein